MPRRPDLLDRLQVPVPCTADWDSMVGNDQVRFCNHCNLKVTNLSAMTRADARRLVRESGGKLCVRYYRKPDGSLLTAPAERLIHISRRASKVAAGAFGAVLTLSAAAVAQTTMPAGADPQNVAGRVIRDGASLTGRVLDPNGAVVINAEVVASNTETQQSQTAYTNLEGVYRFDSLPPGTYSLAATAAGFNVGEVNNVELQQGVEQTRDATLKVQGPQETVNVEATVETVTEVNGGAVIVLPKDPLVLAAFHDDLKAVRELLVSGADVNVVDNDTDTTALAQAVEHGDAEMVRALMGSGAVVNLRDGKGRTALMAVTQDTSADIVRALLAAGAEVNASDSDGNTVLTAGAGRMKIDALQALVDAGADVNARNSEGQTPLMSLSEESSPDVARALITAGAGVNFKDKGGNTALTHAAGVVKVEVLQVLLEAGAKVNARNEDRQTALMFAAQEGAVENVKALILAGADAGVKNNDGETALKLAKDNEHEDVAALLAAFGVVE